MADQSGTHDEAKKAGRKEPRSLPRSAGEKNSRDIGAKYTGPDMFERQLMNDNERQ